MKINERIVYTCEYCNKHYFRKDFAAKHEKCCIKNPDNFKACTNCLLLEYIDYKYYTDSYGIDSEVNTHCFRCKATKQLMYPLLVERKGYAEKYPDQFEEQIKMPKDCSNALYPVSLTIEDLILDIKL